MSNDTFLLADHFYSSVAKRTGRNKEAVKAVWEGCIDLIVEKLLLEGEIKLPHLCTMKSKIIPSRLMNVPNSENDKLRLNTNDAYRLEAVPERYQISFVPNESLKNKFNNNVATPLEKKRYRESIRKEKIIQKMLKEEERLEKVKEEHLMRLEADRRRNMLLRDMKFKEPERYAEEIKKLEKEIKEKRPNRGRPKKKEERISDFIVPASIRSIARRAVYDEITETEAPSKIYDEFGYEIEK